MSNKVKDINTQNRTYYFFNNINNIENFDPNNIKIDSKSYKDILIYYTGYATINEYIKTDSVNPLYLLFKKQMKAKKILKNMSNCGTLMIMIVIKNI